MSRVGRPSSEVAGASRAFTLVRSGQHEAMKEQVLEPGGIAVGEGPQLLLMKIEVVFGNLARIQDERMPEREVGIDVDPTTAV